jgi:hypothetical protein
MIRVSQDVNIAVAGGALGTEIAQGMFRVCRVTGESLINLLVNDDIDLHAGLGATLEDMIEAPVLVLYRWAAEEQFWGEPPVGDVDGLGSLFQGLGDGPEVVETVNVPFDAVSVVDGGEGAEAVGFGDGGAFAVGRLFVFFVVAVIGVYDVEEFADFVFEVGGLGFGVMEGVV